MLCSNVLPRLDGLRFHVRDFLPQLVQLFFRLFDKSVSLFVKRSFALFDGLQALLLQVFYGLPAELDDFIDLVRLLLIQSQVIVVHHIEVVFERLCDLVFGF